MVGPARNREIKFIKDKQQRCVSFTKRRTGLFSMANTMSEVCNADVAAIVFNRRGRMYEFASNSNMEDILTRAGHGHVNLEQQPNSGDKETAVLNSHCSQLRGENLDGLSLEELDQLESRLIRGVELIRQRKSQKLPTKYGTHVFSASPRYALDTTMEDVEIVGQSSMRLISSSSSSSSSVHQNSSGALTRMRSVSLYGNAVDVVSDVGDEKIDPNWLHL